MDRKEAETKVKKVKDLVASKGITIQDACEEVGIKVHQYYHIANPRKKPGQAKAKRKYVRKANRENPQAVKFQEIVIPRASDNRTLIIITTDPATVAGVVEAFRG